MRASDLAASGTSIARRGAHRIPVPTDLSKDASALERDFMSTFWLCMTGGAVRRRPDAL